MVVTTMFLTSCSRDDSYTRADSDRVFTLKMDSENDPAISVFSEIVNEYILIYGDLERPKEDILEDIISITKANNRFMALEGSEGVICNGNDIDEALNSPKLHVQNLSLCVDSENEILILFDEMLLEDVSLDTLIYNFENIIMDNNYITESEKDIILRSCYLTLQSNLNDKDKDWGKTAGVMASSLSGGTESPAQAVFNAAVITALTL